MKLFSEFGSREYTTGRGTRRWVTGCGSIIHTNENEFNRDWEPEYSGYDLNSSNRGINFIINPDMQKINSNKHWRLIELQLGDDVLLIKENLFKSEGWGK